MLIDPLPWQQSLSEKFSLQIENERLPHGLLIAGPSFSGKSKLSTWLAHRLICQSENAPCGQCAQCSLISAGTHPDYQLVTLEVSKQIVIDQIREVIDWANKTAQQSGRKVCVINPADKLNRQSSNALLKCLEEPPRETFIILVTDQPQRLLPTIRSRCQRTDCVAPAKETALSWLRDKGVGPDIEQLLAIADGLPLRVVEELDDQYLQLREELATQLIQLVTGARSPIQVAALFTKQDHKQVLDILYELIADALGAASSDEKFTKNKDIQGVLRQYSVHHSMQESFELLDRISSAKGALAGTSNANPQMLLEWVFGKAA